MEIKVKYYVCEEYIDNYINNYVSGCDSEESSENFAKHAEKFISEYLEENYSGAKKDIDVEIVRIYQNFDNSRSWYDKDFFEEIDSYFHDNDFYTFAPVFVKIYDESKTEDEKNQIKNKIQVDLGYELEIGSAGSLLSEKYGDWVVESDEDENEDE